MRKNMGTTLLIIALLLLVVAQKQVNTNPEVVTAMGEAPRLNYIAPSFVLPGIDGKPYQVGGQRDKLLLINFWASWCEPCHMEADDLQLIYTQYQDHLDIYGVNVTFQDSRAGAVDFVSEYELTFPTLLDVKGEVTRNKYHIDGYPTSFLVNTEGVIVEAFFGLADRVELKRSIEKWLNS